MPGWRFMCASKRARNVVSKLSRCRAGSVVTLCISNGNGSADFLGISQKPLDPSTGRTRQRSRAAIGPVQIQKSHTGRVELCAAFDEVVMSTMTAAHRPSSHRVALAGWRLAHCFETTLHSREKPSHLQLRVDVCIPPELIANS